MRLLSLLCKKCKLCNGVVLLVLLEYRGGVSRTVDGVGVVLCLKAKAGVRCVVSRFALLSVEHVACVELYAGLIGVANHANAASIALALYKFAPACAVNAEVCVIAHAVVDEKMLCGNVTADRLCGAEIEWCARDV